VKIRQFFEFLIIYISKTSGSLNLKFWIFHMLHR